jgi:DNA-binding NarL/FixJ family response regulator
MPGANGVEVAKVVKVARPDVKVMFLSGNLNGEARAELQKLGLTEFVQKPYALEVVGRRLREMLDAK